MAVLKGLGVCLVVACAAVACSTESEGGAGGGGSGGTAASGGGGGGSGGAGTSGGSGASGGGSGGSSAGGGSDAGGGAGVSGGGSAGMASGGAAGTASGGAAGTASGGTAGAASGGTAGASGAAGAPADAGTDGNIQIPLSCASFSPCGGSIVGTWNYTGICLPRAEVFERLLSACPTAGIDQSGGTVTGSLTATATNVLINGTVALRATVTLPLACSFGQCATVQTTIAPYFDSATCSAATGGGCTCTVALSYPLITGDSYTAAGNTLTTAGGRTFDYCQQGNELVYRETTMVDGAPASGAVFELQRN